MRVIPVIDLKDGIVVRGVGGRRAEYRAVRSSLTAEPGPTAVAAAFQRRFGLRELYVADLDAIAGGPPDWGVYAELLALGSHVWLDAGVAEFGRAEELARFAHDQCRLTRVIVGLESLTDRGSLRRMLEIVGPNRLVLSIDLKSGQPLAADPHWQGQAAERIAADALALGVRSIIVLDLAYVGEYCGPGVGPLCTAIRPLDNTAELISGGGVRGVDDLQALAAAGCDAALVASALHDGRLTAADLCSP